MCPVWTNVFFRRLEGIGVGWVCTYGKRQEKAVLGKEGNAAEASREKKKVFHE